MASLKDVAKNAGVSTATVSRYLNRTLELPKETADRIEKSVQMLGYMPNPHARRLSLGRSDTIGLVVPEIGSPFFAAFVAAVEEEADRRGLSLALHATLNRPNREVQYLAEINRNQIDGLIFVTNHPETDALRDIMNSTGKVVIVDEDVPGAQAPRLFCDNKNGGFIAGQHLAAAGHRHVLFVGCGDDMMSGARRYAGFEQAFAGLDRVNVERFVGTYTIETGRAAARQFLNVPVRPTAIFATSDEITIGVMEVLREAGVSIPEEVSIVGFDDVGPLHLFSPAVTAVRQPLHQLGQRALEILLQTVAADAEPVHQEELLPVTLIERDSVASPIRP